MRIILVRHGETEENVKGIVQGHLPGHLTQHGKTQAQRLALRLKDEHIDAIYSSDLDRAADTAKIIARHQDVPLTFTEELREFDTGAYTGKDKRDISWSNPPDDAETLHDAYDRMKSFLDKVYEKHADETVVFVSHGGISKTLVTVIRGMDPRDINDIESFKNTAVSIFEITEDKKHHIHLLNSADHLELPSRKECIAWYEQIGTPDNIMQHVTMVNRVAVFLAERLRKKGVVIDVDMVDRASLLHDLDKWLCIQDKTLDHGYETERILTEKGYPRLGYIARQHRADLMPSLESWEEKVVSYADRRVKNNQVVSVKKRFEYLREKYPGFKKADEMEEWSLKIEREIFDRLDLSPHELKDYVHSGSV